MAKAKSGKAYVATRMRKPSTRSKRGRDRSVVVPEDSCEPLRRRGGRGEPLSRRRNRLALLMQHEGEKQGAGTNQGAQQRSRSKRPRRRLRGQRGAIEGPLVRRGGREEEGQAWVSPIMAGWVMFCWGDFSSGGLDRLLGPAQPEGRGIGPGSRPSHLHLLRPGAT